MFDTLQDAREAFQSDRGLHETNGVYLGGTSYLPERWKKNYRLACDSAGMAYDAQPSLSTTASAGIPWFMVNYVDPAIYKILFAPVKAAKILGEERKGSW